MLTCPQEAFSDAMAIGAISNMTAQLSIISFVII